MNAPTAFLPDTIRAKLQGTPVPTAGLYIGNCVGVLEDLFGNLEMPRRRARRSRQSPARDDGSRSPQGALPTWEERVPLPPNTPPRRQVPPIVLPSHGVGQPRADRQRTRSPVPRRGATASNRIPPSSSAAPSVHTVTPTGVSLPRRGYYLLALSTDELRIIAALRETAGDREGSYRARAAREISVSPGYES